MSGAVIAGVQTLLKIPASVIGKATSQHPGQPCHVTLELALSDGPRQITISFPNEEDAKAFDDVMHYEDHPTNDGEQVRVQHDPQRVYLLVCDADTLDAQDKEFQAVLAESQQEALPPETGIAPDPQGPNGGGTSVEPTTPEPVNAGTEAT